MAPTYGSMADSVKTQVASVNAESPKNKGFGDVHSELTNRGWTLVADTDNELVFSNPLRPYDEYKVVADQESISVVVPMSGSDFSFRTSFNNYFAASEFLIGRLQEYCARQDVQIASMPSKREYEDD